MFNTKFQGNEAISSEALVQRGQGGAIRMREAALHVVNSCFNGNKAKYEGGAIAFDDITTGQPVYGANFRQRIENCKFYSNTADNGSGGGALNFNEVRNGISIKDSDFFNNEHLNAAWNIGLTNGGGAIRVDGGIAATDNYLGTNGPIAVSGFISQGNPIDPAIETTLASGGKLTINADGTYTYVTAADFVGTESVVYTVCDKASPMSCNIATLYLTTIGESVCTALPFTTGADLDTPIGISSLKRNTENWVTDKNAFIKLESKKLGFIPTKMTTAQRDLLSGVVGMVIWNTTTKCLEIYTSNGWKCAKQGCNK